VLVVVPPHLRHSTIRGSARVSHIFRINNWCEKFFAALTGATRNSSAPCRPAVTRCESGSGIHLANDFTRMGLVPQNHWAVMPAHSDAWVSGRKSLGTDEACPHASVPHIPERRIPEQRFASSRLWNIALFDAHVSRCVGKRRLSFFPFAALRFFAATSNCVEV